MGTKKPDSGPRCNSAPLGNPEVAELAASEILRLDNSDENNCTRIDSKSIMFGMFE